MLGIEPVLYNGLIGIFGGNIYFLALFCISMMFLVVWMLRLPTIVNLPLDVMILIIMIGNPNATGAWQIGGTIVIILGIIVGFFMASWIYKKIMGG